MPQQGLNTGNTQQVYTYNPRHLNPLTGDWAEGASWVKRLIFINIAIWVVMVITFRIWPGSPDENGVMTGSAQDWWFRNLALTPRLFLQGRIWQIVTSMFLHSPAPMHLLMNMLIFYIFAPRVERDKGSAWFIKFYLLTGVMGNVLSVIGRVATGMGDVPGVGASGAILGIVAAFCIIYRTQMFWIFWMVPVKVFYIFLFFLAVEVAWILSPAQDCVDHFAHFGGMASAWIFLKTPWFRIGSVTGNVQKDAKPPRTVSKKKKPPKSGGGAKDFLEV